jgi:cell division protein FtsW
MFKRIVKSYDYTLIGSSILLAIFGIVMIYSASMVVAVMEYQVPGDYFMKRQMMWFVISLFALLFFMVLPYKVYEKWVKVIIFGCIGMLALVLIVGRTGGNATSWLAIGGVNIQPSEFAKLAVIIYLASVFSNKQSYIQEFGRAVFPPLIFTIFVFGFVYKQPDLGTGIIILLIASTIIISSGVKWKHLFILILFAGLGAFVIYLSMSSEQLSRFSGAYDPFNSPKGDGYQLVNSYLAIGSGGFKGQGLGESIQKFGYLPEPHTDFIMAIIAEELGFFGVAFVLLLLFAIVIKGLFIAIKCKDPFGSLLAIGISSMIAIQTFVNLGAVTGLMPITGVPLPFISYGGSSLMLLMISVGILANISMFTNYKSKRNQAKTHNVKKENIYDINQYR